MSLLLALTIITGLMSPMTVMSEARSIIIKDNFEPEPLNTDIYAFPVTDYDEETREITLQTFICGVKGRSKIDFHFAITELTFLDWSAPQDGYNHNVIVDGSSYELTVDGYFDDDVVLAATIRYKAPQEEYFDWEIMTSEDSYADGSVLIKTEYEGEYYTAGDVDGDGKVTAEDAQLMLEAYIGECFLSLPALSAAMIDGKDADISISEIRSVLRYASKLDATLGESLTDVPSGYDSNNMPACRIESEYDEEKGFLDITVSAINMKNHHSAKIALEIPDSLRWG